MKKYLLNITILFFAYLIPAKLGFLIALLPDDSTAIWPASGVASAGIILLGYRALPGVFLGSLFANLDHNVSFDTLLLQEVFNYLAKEGVIAIGAMAESFTVAWIVHRFIGFPSTLSHWRDILILFLIAGFVGSIPSPTIGVTTLYLHGFFPLDNYMYLWSSWWVGNSLGIVTFTPILITIFSPKKYISTKRKIYIAIPLTIALILVGLVLINTNKN